MKKEKTRTVLHTAEREVWGGEEDNIRERAVSLYFVYIFRMASRLPTAEVSNFSLARLHSRHLSQATRTAEKDLPSVDPRMQNYAVEVSVKTCPAVFAPRTRPGLGARHIFYHHFQWHVFLSKQQPRDVYIYIHIYVSYITVNQQDATRRR